MDAETALRLIDLDQRLKGIEVLSRPFTDSGSSFPTTQLFVGRRFFRTDLLMNFIFDGTRWWADSEQSFVINEQALFSANGNTVPRILICSLPSRIVAVSFGIFVATSNNASNFWSIEVQAVNDAFSTHTSVLTVTTASIAPNTNTRVQQAATTPEPGLGRVIYRLGLTKTGSPGDLRIMSSFSYRLVST
jgi:hypothetical protein